MAGDATSRIWQKQLGYKSNVENLEKTAALLKKSRIDVENFFEEQRRNNEEPAQSTVGWLDEVKEVMKDAKQIAEDIGKLNGGLNLKGWFDLSRKSTNLVADILKRKSEAPQGITANTVLPAGSLPGASANEASKGYKTRMQTLDEVMVALEDPAIRFIGLCGMGGVGKTTMLHEVREMVRTQNLFDETAMSTVSQKIDLFKIQADLADMLDLKAIKEKENVITRADQLRLRLTGGNKVLIILDDVWSDINLKEVGIPKEHSKCKVLITSRQEGVCTDIQKNIIVHALAKEEARALFRKTAGEQVEKNNIWEIADKVADECEGLPIALLTLSRALSNKGRSTWEDALTQLRGGHITGITGMEQEVYKSIKFSYDFLATEKKEAQPLLLLCCQHQEDAKINVEKLARYCLFLDLFEGVSGIVRARKRVDSLIEYLRSCFLLQAIDADDEDEERGDETVKVHDVVRDVCRSIASKERDRVCMHIWNQEDGAGVGGTDLDYQKLKILVEVPFHLKDLSGVESFLEQTQELRVLESARFRASQMDKQNSDPSLVPQFLTNLRMLSLEHTYVYPGVMSEFTRLTELEVLSFMGSTIVSFPHQIGQLRELKLLDLRCRYADRKLMIPIPSGIMPKLTKLEVVFMGNHYFPEADMDKESYHGRIEDLYSLTNLTTLQVDLLHPMQLQHLKYFRFEKLDGFSFSSAGNSPSFGYRNSSYPLHMKNICLKEVGVEWVLEDNIQSIVRSTVNLSLQDIEDLTDTSIFKQFASLRKLVLRGCHKLEYIIHDGSSGAFINMNTLRIQEMMNVRELFQNGHLPTGSLHKLQRLEIVDLPEMRHLWVGHTDPLCLINLKLVSLKDCGNLKFIFPHSAAKCLSQLQKLTVIRCHALKGILSKSGEGNSTGRGGEITQESQMDLLIHFPKLTDFIVRYSPNLQGVYNLDDGRGQSLFNPLVVLPSIEKLEVRKNHLIKALFDFEGLEAMTMREDERLLLCELRRITLCSLTKLEHLCRQVPKDVPIFQNLATLNVKDCHNLANLLPSSLARMLVNLRELTVVRCKGMKEVISEMNEEEEDCGELEKNIVFPSLTEVTLEGLENLSSFCSSDQQVFEFPSLEELSIIQCPEIETFCCQIPRVALSELLEENVAKAEGTTTGGGRQPEIYCIQKPRVAKIKMDPRDLVALFPKLEEVKIEYTPNFRGFYNIDSYKGYQKLVNLEVGASYQLKRMVEEGGDNLVSVASSDSLNLVQNLKHIRLKKCESIKTVLDFERFDVSRVDAHAVFSRLETIWLHQFSNLEHICKLLPREINGFENLRSLHVYGCHSLSYLLTSTMAHMLLNLKFLVVWNCKSMKEVIKMDEDCGANRIVFRSLCRVGLVSTKKLSSFCSSELQEFDFPSLNQVYILNCPSMKTFCCGHLNAEKLHGVGFTDDSDYESDGDSEIENSFDDYNGDDGYYGDCEAIWKGDVNETIRQYNARVNQLKIDLREDGVDDAEDDGVDEDDEAEEEDGDDAGDKPSFKE